ncbi:MAG: amidase family protein, partial [Actinomycetota bacterium]
AAAVGAFIASGPPGLDPTVSAIIADGEGLTAVDYARDRDTLAALAAAAGRLWQEVDALLLPTVPRHPSIAEVRAEPVAVNAELGRFVSGANLVDWCAAVVPIEAAGISLGVQLLGPAWSDESLWRTAALMLGTEAPGPSEAVGQISIAVVGAHLSGEPLNHQLTDRGARLLRTTRTADAYRMVLLDGPVAKPGLLRDSTTSASFEVEVWELDAAGFGTFVDEIPGPLAIGTVELQDGSTVNGFVCEGEAAAHAADISVHGGWRAWLAST